MTDNTSIEKVILVKLSDAPLATIKKINTRLNLATREFEREASECAKINGGSSWEYKSKFEKIVVSKLFISVIFQKFSVCKGTPDIAKQPKIFLRGNGKFFTNKQLFEKVFPLKSNEYMFTDVDLVQFDDEITNKIVRNTKEKIPNLDPTCEYYIRNSAYRIWVDDNELIAFPEYLQSASHCQREYAVKIDG